MPPDVPDTQVSARAAFWQEDAYYSRSLFRVTPHHGSFTETRRHYAEKDTFMHACENP
jgi:hypothetical protein